MDSLNKYFESQLTNIRGISKKEAAELVVDEIVLTSDGIKEMDIDAMQTENDLEELQFQCEILLVESFHTMAKLTNAGINSIILRPPTDVLHSLFELYEKKKEVSK